MGRPWALSLLFASRVLAFQHHLFTSSISTPHMFALEFDDEDNTIVNIANMSAHGGHPWLSFSYDKASVYAGEADGFASYTVENVTSLLYKKSIQIGNQCGPGMNGKAPPYVIAEQRTPFNVFGAPVATCGTAMSVEIEGGLDKIVQAYKYNDRSNIQGLTLDPENRYLYSADEGNNGIWTHAVTDQGTVQQLGFTQAPLQNSSPKKVVVHPNGRFLYAILSRPNKVVVYAINQGPEGDRTPLTYTGVSYDLLPEGFNPAQYSTDELYLSADANVLFVTARYRVESDRNNQSPPAGYIRAILLTALAEQDVPIGGRTVGAGFPIRELFHLETRTSGGLTNAVAPAPWANEYFALADSQFGLIEIWRIDNMAAVNYTGALAQGAATPPRGGWLGQVWSQQGAIQTADAPLPAQPTAPPSQSGQPFGNRQPKPKSQQPAPPTNLPWNAAAPPQPKQTTNPLFPPWQQPAPAPKQPAPKQGGGGGAWPWAGQQPAPAGNTWPWPAGNVAGGAGGAVGGGVNPQDDDDDLNLLTVAPTNAFGRQLEEDVENESLDDDDDMANVARRDGARSRIARILPRQQQPFTPGAPVVVNIVASWQAPADGGKAGRRSSEQASEQFTPGQVEIPVRLATHQKVNVKPWTGSKKRSANAQVGPIKVAEQNTEDLGKVQNTESTQGRAYAQFAGTQWAEQQPKQQQQQQQQQQNLNRGCCGNAIWFD